MVQQFLGKIAVVLGGNSGIGLATARALANEGARVVITGRNDHTLQSAVRDLGRDAIAHRCDISDVRQIESLFTRIGEELGRIDILFVNAGVGGTLGPFESITEADWDEVQDTNLKGAFFSVQRALPLLLKGSSVVLTGSIASLKGAKAGAVYAASKAGLRALGRSLAVELVERGIRVNLVSPGFIETPIFHRIGGVSQDAVPDLRQTLIELTPMKRMGTPEEVAAAVLFLASADAAFVTGIDFIVDGGTTSA